MALPTEWDGIEEGTSLLIGQMVSTEKKVQQALQNAALTKDQLLAALLAARPETSRADACQVEAYKPRPHPKGAEDIQKLQQQARTQHTLDKSKLDAEKARIAGEVSAAKKQNANEANQSLLQAQGRLKEVKATTEKLAEMDPITGKGRNEVLQSVHDAVALESMGPEQKSEAFRKLNRSRIAGRRAAAATVAGAISQASKRPAKLEEIHAGLEVAKAFQATCTQMSNAENEATQICKGMQAHLAKSKSQLEASQQDRAEAFRKKQQAVAELRKTLQELKKVGSAYVDAWIKLEAKDAALDILQQDVETLEQKATACESSSKSASEACQACRTQASAAEKEVRQAVTAAAEDVLKHAQAPCATAFENVLAVLTLLGKADEEVSKEIDSLTSDQEALQRELAEATRLWEEGQTTDEVANKSAVVKDGLASVQKDLDAALGTQQQLHALLHGAAEQRKTFVDLAKAGFAMDEAASQGKAEALVEDAWGTLKITAATRRATGCMNASTASDAAAASSSTAIQSQIPSSLEAVMQRVLQEAMTPMREQLMMDVRMEFARLSAAQSQGSDAGSWLNVDEPPPDA